MDFFNHNPHQLTPEEKAAVGVLRFGKANALPLLAVTRAVHNSYTARKVRPPSNLNVIRILDSALSKGIPVIPTLQGDGYFLADTAGELAEYQRRLGAIRRLTNKRLHNVAYALRTMKGMWGSRPAVQVPPQGEVSPPDARLFGKKKEIVGDEPAAVEA